MKKSALTQGLLMGLFLECGVVVLRLRNKFNFFFFYRMGAMGMLIFDQRPPSSYIVPGHLTLGHPKKL